jgi:hypothetical protein
MKTLKLNKPWSVSKQILQPGDYCIPADISMTHAKCAQADGAGEIVETASFPAPSRKGPAPENKAMEPAPENKADLVEPDGDRGGERAKPQRKPGRKRAPKRPADDSGQ